jgi:YD repeat-containing protein
VTNDSFHTYTYDAENRMITVNSPSTQVFFYDALGRRTQTTPGFPSPGFPRVFVPGLVPCPPGFVQVFVHNAMGYTKKVSREKGSYVMTKHRPQLVTQLERFRMTPERW